MFTLFGMRVGACLSALRASPGLGSPPAVGHIGNTAGRSVGRVYHRGRGPRRRGVFAVGGASEGSRKFYLATINKPRAKFDVEQSD